MSSRLALLLLMLASARALADGPAAGAAVAQLAPPSDRAGGRFVLTTHVAVGAEPHFQGTPIAFNLGGEALWRGLVGISLGLYSSEGVTIMPMNGGPGLADRVSFAVSLAVRPLAPFTWRMPSTGRAGYLARFLQGVGVEVGPSLEYFRTSSLTNSTCPDIGSTASKAGAHFGASIEAPLLGGAASGWIALRASARVIVTSRSELAPPNAAPCLPLVVEPGVSSQLFLGIAYYL